MPSSKSDPRSTSVCPHCAEPVRPIPVATYFGDDDPPQWGCPACGGGLWNVGGPTLGERLAGAIWGQLAPLRSADHGAPMLAVLESLLEGDSQIAPASEGLPLLRALPLALVDRRLAVDLLVGRVHRASAASDDLPRVQVACALYVLVARVLLEGRLSRDLAMGEALLTLRYVYATNRFTPEHRAALVHLENLPERADRRQVRDTFWSAWDAFAGADSYTQAIERAMPCGRPTAALAGGLAGIQWGIAAIPAEWRAAVREQEVVTSLAERLIALNDPARGRPP